MKAISLWQPWATLVSSRQKTIETRSYPTKVRGPIAIHATAKFPKEFERIVKTEPFDIGLRCWIASQSRERQGDLFYRFNHCINPHRVLPLGVIVATCELVDCVPVESIREKLFDGYPYGYEYYFGDYSDGRYAWILGNIVALPEPIPAKGKQGFWNWEDPRGTI
jgi:hypothetical protein